MIQYGMKPFEQEKPSWKSIILNKEFVILCKIIFGIVISFCAGLIYFGFIEIKNKIKKSVA